MAKIIPITEHYQHFLAEMKESFWGDVYGETKLAWKRLLEADSERQRDRYAVRDSYERRRHRRQPYRNGFYERDFVTRLGTIRLRIARTRGKSFLPRALEPFQRRAEDVAMLIREAFLRGISTRQVGRVVATLTGEVVSAQTVSKLTRDLDEAVKQFHQARLSDDYAYLFLDDGCAGLAAAIPTVYPRVRHQRCWVHKMRNILEKVRKRDYDEVKAGAQAIYLAQSRAQAEAAFRRFRARWLREYGPMVRRLDRDLAELLSVFAFPRHLWRKLRTTNLIERCFVEVRRRTRPMVCFVNVQSVDRIIYSIFQRFNYQPIRRRTSLYAAVMFLHAGIPLPLLRWDRAPCQAI
jgi:transposase-like protein